MIFNTEALKKIIHINMTPVNTFLNVPIYATLYRNDLIYKDTNNTLLFYKISEYDARATRFYFN